MKILILALLLFLAPECATGKVTKTVDLVSANYTLLFSPDRKSYGEGILLTYEMSNKRTRIGVGFSHTSLDKQLPKGSLESIGIDISGEVAGLPIDVNVGLDGVTYSSKRTGSMFDILLLGEYNYFDSIWRFGKRERMRKTHAFSLWAGVGAKMDVTIQNTEYSLYVDGELFDTLENPLSQSKTSGIKFMLSHGINYRFSMLNIGVHTMISIPKIKKSILLIYFGFSI